MTAEIAVMNKEAIALAADSAVTMRDQTGEKVFPSANKIFALSKYEPIAAMIFGNASFMGVPWEPAIKLFRKELGRTSYATAEEYGQHLFRFLRAHRGLFPDEQCDLFCRLHVDAQLRLIRHTAKNRSKGPNVTDPEYIDPLVLAAITDAWEKFWREAKRLPDLTVKQAAKARGVFKELATKGVDHAFDGIKLDPRIRGKLFSIGISSILKCPQKIVWPSATGLVVAGFGTKEFYPVVRCYSLHGVFGGRLHYRVEEGKCGAISFAEDANITPFAQTDVVYSFMEGVDPEYERLIEADMSALLQQFPQVILDGCKFLDDATRKRIHAEFDKARTPVLQKYIDELSTYRAKKFASPVLQLVSMLPKGELATLAESMVNLTSLRRKMSMDAETVGGPIDVAIISKGDGLIWMKRKHYFDPRLNRQFFDNYNLGVAE